MQNQQKHQGLQGLLGGLLILIGLLSGCSKPEVHPTDANPTVQQFFSDLKSGHETHLKTEIFEPLSWRRSAKLITQFRETHQAIAQGTLKLTPLKIKQKGRWAIAAVKAEKWIKDEQGQEKWTTEIQPYWFFYYDGRWQYISPILAGTREVKAMMDLYREQDELRRWFMKTYSPSAQ